MPPPRRRSTTRSVTRPGALRFDIDLARAGASRDVYLAIPFGRDRRRAGGVPAIAITGADALHAPAELLARAGSAASTVTLLRVPRWQRTPTPMRTAASGTCLDRALRSGAAAGSAPLHARPGSATARSWRRRSSASERDEARSSSYAGTRASRPPTAQRALAAVDENGPDWLVEHDSHGELVFAVAECSASPATAPSSTRSGRTSAVAAI